LRRIEIGKDPHSSTAVVGSTPSPWLAVHASAVRSMTQLAGLSPKARTPKQLASKRGPPPSYYDQMRMERER
jgi:hypothetical protein